MFNPRQPRPTYARPSKPKFGHILKSNTIIKRDLNKDLMMKTQPRSEIKNASKRYWRK